MAVGGSVEIAQRSRDMLVDLHITSFEEGAEISEVKSFLSFPLLKKIQAYVASTSQGNDTRLLIKSLATFGISWMHRY